MTDIYAFISGSLAGVFHKSRAADESIIMALEPVDVSQWSSLHAVRLRYSNQWGVPYSIDVGPRFEAKPNCLLEVGDED